MTFHINYTTMWRIRCAAVLSCNAIYFLRIPSCLAYKPEGFISIDCGSTRKEYVDPITNLTWEGDAAYMLSGTNGVISNKSNLDPNLNSDDILDISQALMDFRYFPKARQKYCYELPLSSNSTTFLLRAMFLHGGLPPLEEQTAFQIYINATLWRELIFNMDSAPGPLDDVTVSCYTGVPEVVEGIFFNPGANVVSVCLVRNTGIPFISSLELRELDHSGLLYSDYLFDALWGQSLFLTTLVRWSMLNSNTLFRYPDDVFDRFWDNQGYFLSNNTLHALDVNLSNVNVTASNALPPKILQRGVPVPVGQTEDYPFPGNVTVETMSISCFIFYLHTHYSSQRLSVPVDLTVDDKTEMRNTQSEIPVETVYVDLSGKHDDDFGQDIPVDVRSPHNLSLDLLAGEVYQQGYFSASKIQDASVEFLNFMKKNTSLSDWQGDPCVPVPNDWLECANVYDYIVLSINLSYISNTESLASYSGPQAFPYLYNLSFTHSGISDRTFLVLLQNSNRTFNPPHMNLSNNNLNDLWNISKWHDSAANLYLATVLDISHNKISKAPLIRELEYTSQFDGLRPSHRLSGITVRAFGP